MIFRFAEYELSREPLELRKEGKLVAVPKRILQTLSYLLEQQGNIVTKQDLIENVWLGRIVTDAAIAKRIEKVRRTIGECGSNPRFIQTVYGRGFVFEGSVSLSGIGATDKTRRALTPSNTVDWIGKIPVVAILKFSSNELPGRTALLADGLAVDIITALAGVGTLRVIARASSLQFGSRTTRPQLARTALGADYSLSGELRKSGAGLIVDVELADTSDETIVWADKFDIGEHEVHAVRRDIVSRIVSQTEAAIPKAQASRLLLHEPDDMTAWEAYHVGTSLIGSRVDIKMAQAERYFERAIQIDPGFARAHAGLTLTLLWKSTQRPNMVDAKFIARMMQSAENGLRADPNDAAANLYMGRALSCASKKEDASDWFRKGTELSPSYAMAHTQMLLYHALAGCTEKALQHGEQSLVLSPQDSLRFTNYGAMAAACFRSQQIDQGILWGMKAADAPFDDIWLMVVAMGAFNRAGETAKARRIAERIRTVFPNTTITGLEKAMPFASEAPLARLRLLLKDYGFSDGN